MVEAYCGFWLGTWYGLGLFLRDVHRPPDLIIRGSLLRLWILEFTYAYSLGFSKFSILALYWRFFGLFRARVPIIVLLIATGIWLLCRVCMLPYYPLPLFELKYFHSLRYLISSLIIPIAIEQTFLGLFHCVPPQAFWNMTPGANCPIDDTKFEFGSVVVHVFLDIAIVSMPVFGLRELTFRTMSQRLGILAMFLSGAL